MKTCGCGCGSGVSDRGTYARGHSPHPMRKKEISDEKLRELYWKDGLSLNEIAKLADVTPLTVKKWLNGAGIATRSLGQARIVALKSGRAKSPAGIFRRTDKFIESAKHNLSKAFGHSNIARNLKYADVWYLTLKCLYCERDFRRKRSLEERRKRRGADGPFCRRECATKYQFRVKPFIYEPNPRALAYILGDAQSK